MTFSAVQISEHVYWVGAIDWSIRDFHGYSTSRGTTYNAFLILGESPVLIDTVKAPFFHEMMSRIRSVIDPKKITTLISNHAEMDHSGSLPAVVEEIQPRMIYASKMGVQALKDHFHQDFSVTAIQPNQPFEIGTHRFRCVETRMLHWPDSMFTYYENDGVLFSQDAFGMHYATRELDASKNSRDILRAESAKYFANILMPYASFVSKCIQSLPSLGFNLRIVAPDHGPLWMNSNDIEWVVGLWKNWASPVCKEKVVVVYDTMWGSTQKMAQALADGIADQQVFVVVLPLSGSHRSDIATEILEASGLLVGSPVLNQQMFPTVADTLCYLKGLKPTHLKGQAFGSYGWNQEGIQNVCKELEAMKVELFKQPLSCKYVPTQETLSVCKQFGNEFAQMIKEHHDIENK